MGITKIEWADLTFNCWIGCAKVSPGCKFCYAEADMDKRRKRAVWGACGTRSVTSYSYWQEALKWNREAQHEGVRKRVFCASLADVFEDFTGQIVDNKGNPLWLPLIRESFVDVLPRMVTVDTGFPLTLSIIRMYLFKLMEATPWLDWLIVTKRPENAMSMVPKHWQTDWPVNVWMGVSVENQNEANNRIPYLLKIPAPIHFVSQEPNLGLVDYTKILVNGKQMFGMDAEEVTAELNALGDGADFEFKIDWIIVGGESGEKARPMHPSWVLSVQQQCAEYDTHFFFKQWGEYAWGANGSDIKEGKNLMFVYEDGTIAGDIIEQGRNAELMTKVGKHNSGALINGNIYRSIPVVEDFA